MSAALLTVRELRELLADRAEDVARQYAPEAAGAHLTQGGWWTLNPGRPDRRVGSFVVWVAGARRGRWNDYATGEHGDLLDLIRLALGCSLADALREARRFLGLEADHPAERRRRQAALEAARARAGSAAAAQSEKRERTRRAAHRLWLAARERISGTPVEAYLRDARGIDLRALGRQPRALRYDPACFWSETDPRTGEVAEAHLPAMLAIVTGPDGRALAVHRTYLAQGPDGCWRKARVARPKKVLGAYRGGAIRIWRGLPPPGRAQARRFAEMAPDSHLYLTEGIEDALSLVTLCPEARVICGLSLSNLGAVALPAAVTRLTIVADCDEGREAQAALARAVAAQADAGREVRLWRNRWGGKDLNDALRAAAQAGEVRHAQQ